MLVIKGSDEKWYYFYWGPDTRFVISTPEIIVTELKITFDDKVFTPDTYDFSFDYRLKDRWKCIPTEYAIAQGVTTSGSGYDSSLNGIPTCWWWQR